MKYLNSHQVELAHIHHRHMADMTRTGLVEVEEANGE